MATNIAFLPRQAVEKPKRERSSRSLKAPARATTAHIQAVIERAREDTHNHPPIAGTEAFDAIVELMQLTNGRLRRQQSFNLTRLALHFSPRVSKKGL